MKAALSFTPTETPLNAARQREFNEEELRLEFALLELAAALDALREREDPERMRSLIQAHHKVGEANARLLELVTDLLLDAEEEDTVPTEI